MEIKRPLKRAMPKLGPPDIYPQDPKQKEDELTSVNVKQGYTSAPLVSGPNSLDEFGSAKNANIDAFGVFFSALLSEKHRINTLKDTQRKKQLVNTKEIWYVHAKTKHAVDNWFRDLANGTKSLSQLGKRIPIFNSKEGMFTQLYESHVPLAKAVWFIKMSAVHAIALSESSSKSKKRQVPDQYQEITTALTKYLKEISIRLSECYQQSQQNAQQMQQQSGNQLQKTSSGQTGPTVPSAFNNSLSILQQRNNPKLPVHQKPVPKLSPLSAGSHYNLQQNSLANSYTSSLLNQQQNFTSNLHTTVATLITSHTASAASLSATSITFLPVLHEDFIPTFNQWQYQTQLARYLFDEGLLDHYDFLCFLLELIERRRPINDLVVRVICPLILEYVIDFSRSAVLSRRLAHVCAKKLCQALNHHPLSARSSKKNELANQPGNNTSLNNLTVNKFNQLDNRILENQSSSLLKNSSSSANSNHLTATSILDIVKSQIIESQNNFVESLSVDQENNDTALYKNAVYILSSILQVICIRCPTAMVRHHIVDAKSPHMFQGSPLDHLPCLPSSLPMMESDLNFELRKSIHDAEREILHRSAMADSKWSCDSSSKVELSKSSLVDRLLNVMDILDKHNFDKIDSVNSIDLLYSKIFPPLQSNQNVQPINEPATNTETGILDLSSTSSHYKTSTIENNKRGKQSGNPSSSDISLENLHNQYIFEDQVVKLLCEWATTVHRSGEHRALVVARLLERRQNELQIIYSGVNKVKCEEDSCQRGSYNNLHGQDSSKSDNQMENQEEVVLSFQNLLVQFLDENSPIIDDSQNDQMDDKKAFNNLVLLFSELIRCDVFSHYNYMCTLISRGMFNDLSKSANPDSFVIDSAPNSNINQPGSVKPPKSVGKESDSLLANTIQGLASNSNIYPLTVSTNSGPSSNNLDQLSVNRLAPDQSLRSLGFSPVSSQQNMSQGLDRCQGILDNHIDDVDADLGKILQDIKEGQQDEAADILLPDYLGAGHREDTSNKHTHISKLSPFGLSDRPSNLESTPTSFPTTNPLDSKPIELAQNCEDKMLRSPSEHRHMTYVKHFPVPDEDHFMPDNNQRNILLYGFGKEREEARHTMKKLNKEISKLLSRRACRDINEGGKVKKLASRDGFNPEMTLHKFDALNHHDQHIITNGLTITVLEMYTSVSNGQTSLLPTLESMSFVFDLFTIASNVSGLLDLIIPVLEELPDVEAQIKLKCPALTNQYTHSIAICIIGMLYRYHSSVLLSGKDELCSIFESLQKIVSHIPHPGSCSTSAERVIFHYLYDLYSSQQGRIFDHFTNLIQKIYQTIINAPQVNQTNAQYEWTPTSLTTVVNQLRNNQLCCNSSTNPILNASSGAPSIHNFSQINSNDITITIRQQFYSHDSTTIRQIDEVASIRYRFVCDAIYLSASSTSPDLVNDIAVLCSDVTARCPALAYDWVLALQALCCSSQRDLTYHQLTLKINVSDPQVMDNIAIFSAIMIARRCLHLKEFLIKCAISAIMVLAAGSVDRQSGEPGVRLTCHILLALFKDRESPVSQNRNNHSSALSTQIFGQTFPNYGCSTPSYSGIMGSVSSLGLLQPMLKDEGGSKSTICLKYLCDHHLLRSACCNIKTECHITLLKAIRVLAIRASPTNDSDVPTRIKIENHFEDMSVDGIGQSVKDVDPRDVSPMSSDLKDINLQTASLHQFADAVLRLLCSQRWLQIKCLSDSEIFTTIDPERNILLDSHLDVKQSQRLLYMICYNKSPEKQVDVGLDDQGSDQVVSIVKMFESLDVWSMRLSLMRLQFMFSYCKSQSSGMLNDWLDNLAKAVVEFFQKSSQENENQERDSDDNNDDSQKAKSNLSEAANNSVTNINKVWLIEPLLDKLTKPPSAVQSKIIKASASLMESASVRANSLPSLNQTYLSTAAASTKFKERTLSQRGSASTNPSNLASTSLLGFQPFLSLLLSCLRNQDRERETLLTSLNSQLYQAIHEKVDDIGYKQSLQDGLELRLCLIGQMFDTIQKSANLTSDWATLLLLLIMNNLVDPQVDYGLYVSVLDMLAMLIHSAYASDPIEQKEEAKKQYQSLMKKFRKELAALEEKGLIQMKLITPFMPLVRRMTEVITCEPMGSLVDTKGEKVENFYSIDKKKGLKVSELQEVSPWDLIEGHKNPAPLSWPWFGAIRLEQKPLRADENNRLMSWHTHTLRHPTSYFCQIPNIEDGPSSAKRSNPERKPSQSNPLLKSLIEANDDNISANKIDLQNCISDEDLCHNESLDEYSIGRDDLMEDYCEMPVDMLFDSTPIETMIEDIKTAMQAEQAANSNRAKLHIVDTKPIINSSQASSILAPVQPDPNRSSTPQVSALSALQNHLNASSSTESSILVSSSNPGSVPPMSISPMNPRTPEVIPARPPSNIPKIVPTPPPPSVGGPLSNRSMSPMVVRSPAVVPTPPPPKPRAPRKKRTKKDTNAIVVLDTNANVPPNLPINKNLNQSSMMSSPMTAYANTSGPMIVNQNKQPAPPMHMQQPHPMQQSNPPTMIVRRGPPMGSQQIAAPQPQTQQQQASVYDFPYQPQSQSNSQFMNNGSMNSYYEQQGPTNSMFANQPQQQGQMAPMNIQHQHHLQHQIQNQQHIQQPIQHHQMQYQHQHGPPHQHQQIRLTGHQQHQQTISFQQAQQQQPQQIFAPQQAAGHSRPALTAMLHQKHAAAGNMDNKMHPQPRMHFG